MVMKTARSSERTDESGDKSVFQTTIVMEVYRSTKDAYHENRPAFRPWEFECASLVRLRDASPGVKLIAMVCGKFVV
jgi:hypothetical protein